MKSITCDYCRIAKGLAPIKPMVAGQASACLYHKLIDLTIKKMGLNKAKCSYSTEEIKAWKKLHRRSIEINSKITGWKPKHSSDWYLTHDSEAHNVEP